VSGKTVDRTEGFNDREADVKSKSAVGSFELGGVNRGLMAVGGRIERPAGGL